VTIHFIGVCGTAMATLAALLKRKGLDVQGSAAHVYPPMSTFLESEQIRTMAGYRAEHITGNIDLVPNSVSSEKNIHVLLKPVNPAKLRALLHFHLCMNSLIGSGVGALKS